jgi:hypothetical protein
METYLKYFGDHNAFLNQMRVNVREHTVIMAPCECLWKVSPGGVRQEEGKGRGVGERIGWKLSDVNNRAVSRGQDELIGKFKMAVGDVLGGRLWSTCTFQQELKESC